MRRHEGREPHAGYQEAVECDITLGEISDALREVFGEYREKVTV